MSEKIDNPSAFPCPIGHIECYHPQGMTLRDYFAGQALVGMLANSFWVEKNGAEPDKVAAESYAYADTMLKERAKV